MGFSPQPNYILASTASIAFLMSAATTHWLIAWHHQVPLSLALVLSSIWFHTQKTYTAYIADQIAILLWVLSALYEAYIRGPIPVGMGAIVFAYDMLLFYAGSLGDCYAFDPDPDISTFFHATLHFVSFLGVLAVLSCQEKTDTDALREEPSLWTAHIPLWMSTKESVYVPSVEQCWEAILTRVPSGGTTATETTTRDAPEPSPPNSSPTPPTAP